MIESVSGNILKDDAEALVQEIWERQIRSIAVPPLGTGLGGLQWDRVKGMIEATFEGLPKVLAKLYKPRDSPDAKYMPVESLR